MTREAFKVVTVLEIKGNAVKQMQRFAELTAKTHKAVTGLADRIKIFNTSLKTLDTNLTRLNPHADRMMTLFRGLSSGANMNNRSFSKFNLQLDRSNEATTALAEKTIILSDGIKKIAEDSNLAAASLARMNSAGAAARLNQITGAGGGGTREPRSRRSGHRYMHGMSHVIGSEGSAVMSAGMSGGAWAIGGLVAAMAMRAGFEKSMEYGKDLSQFQAIGFTPDQMQNVQNLTSVGKPGVSPLRQIQAYKDAQMATRKWSDAKVLAPTLEKMKFIADAMFSGFSESQLQSAVRIAEIRGGANPLKIKDELSTVMQMYTTSAGTITPTDYLAFFRRYQGASRISREGLLALEPTIQEIKPTTVGTALQTLYTRLHGGVKLTNKAEGFFESIGLFKNGKLLQKYSDILDQDPDKFIEQVWIPLLAKHGIITPNAIAQASLNLGNTPSRLVSTVLKNTEKNKRAREQESRLMGVDDLMQTAFKTQGGAALRFMQALESLVITFGKFSAPASIAFLNSLSWFMEKTAILLNKDQNYQYVVPTTIYKGGNNKLKDFWERHFGNSSVTNPASKDQKETHVTVNVDGQKLAKVVAKHTSASMTRGGTQSAPSGVNPMMTPQPTALNYYGGGS